MKINCGACSHFYCGNCVKNESRVDALDEACSVFIKFNRYEYVSNKKQGVI